MHFSRKILLIFTLVAFCLSSSVEGKTKKKKHHKHHTTHHVSKNVPIATHRSNTETIPLSSLPDFDHYPPEVKKLVKEALSLAGQHLRYIYGSSNPNNGGMDCSGTIYYLLHHASNAEPPRQADEMYDWLEEAGNLQVVTHNDLDSSDFAHLKPGDLLFWSGTYHTNRKISHVMLYLGKNTQDKPLMFGASVFDFKLPRDGEKAKFKGYGTIPF